MAGRHFHLQASAPALLLWTPGRFIIFYQGLFTERLNFSLFTQFKVISASKEIGGGRRCLAYVWLFLLSCPQVWQDHFFCLFIARTDNKGISHRFVTVKFPCDSCSLLSSTRAWHSSEESSLPDTMRYDPYRSRLQLLNDSSEYNLNVHVNCGVGLSWFTGQRE